MDEIYSYPHYYDIAFGYRDIAAEIDELERCFQRFASPGLESILELGCGTAPHMPALTRRGYFYTGLDISPSMLAFAEKRSERHNAPAQFLRGDMVDFQVPQSADCLLILLGSLYVKNTEELKSHLRAAAAALKPGGLFILDWCIDFEPLADRRQFWQERSGGVHIDVTYTTKTKDPSRQLYEETIILDVQDGHRQRSIHSISQRRAIYPQEFLLALELVGHWEFLGWYQDWNIDRPLDGLKHVENPLVVLRRT